MATTQAAPVLHRMSREEFESNAVVTQATVADWLQAIHGPARMTVPRVRTDKVVAPTAPPPSGWAVL